MRLPNPRRAIIALEKIQGYLLSPVHPIGRHKAAFFQSLGYTQDHPEVLESALRAFLDLDAEEVEETVYGRKYEIRGPITGPDERSATLVTAWIVLHGDDVARFITAYPED